MSSVSNAPSPHAIPFAFDRFNQPTVFSLSSSHPHLLLPTSSHSPELLRQAAYFLGLAMGVIPEQGPNPSPIMESSPSFEEARKILKVLLRSEKMEVFPGGFSRWHFEILSRRYNQARVNPIDFIKFVVGFFRCPEPITRHLIRLYENSNIEDIPRSLLRDVENINKFAVVVINRIDSDYNTLIQPDNNTPEELEYLLDLASGIIPRYNPISHSLSPRHQELFREARTFIGFLLASQTVDNFSSDFSRRHFKILSRRYERARDNSFDFAKFVIGFYPISEHIVSWLSNNLNSISPVNAPQLLSNITTIHTFATNKLDIDALFLRDRAHTPEALEYLLSLASNITSKSDSTAHALSPRYQEVFIQARTFLNSLLEYGKANVPADDFSRWHFNILSKCYKQAEVNRSLFIEFVIGFYPISEHIASQLRCHLSNLNADDLPRGLLVALTNCTSTNKVTHDHAFIRHRLLSTMNYHLTTDPIPPDATTPLRDRPAFTIPAISALASGAFSSQFATKALAAVTALMESAKTGFIFETSSEQPAAAAAAAANAPNFGTFSAQPAAAAAAAAADSAPNFETLSVRLAAAAPVPSKKASNHKRQKKGGKKSGR